MSLRRALAASIAIAFHAVAIGAQTPGNGLELRAAATDSSRIDGGSVFTSVFTVKNLGADTARVQPTLIVPRGWTIVMGNSAFAIAPGKTETWLVGVSVPGSAPAARYTMRGALVADGSTVSDSIVVQVNEHRAIEIVSLEVPGWVIAGSRYEARFLVRNRGNVPSTVALSGSTSRGTRVETDPSLRDDRSRHEHDGHRSRRARRNARAHHRRRASSWRRWTPRRKHARDLGGAHDRRAAHLGRKPRHRAGDALASLDRRGVRHLPRRARGSRHAGGRQDRRGFLLQAPRDAIRRTVSASATNIA